MKDALNEYIYYEKRVLRYWGTHMKIFDFYIDKNIK